MIGIIMLNTKFPRLKGDIGNPETFKTAPIYAMASQATVDKVVTSAELSSMLQESMIQAARDLENRGADVIGTSCGFLSLIQDRLRESISIPVISSSLVLLPMIRTIFGPAARVGVLTADSSQLTLPHCFDSSHSNISICGLNPNGELYRCLMEDRSEMDEHLARLDVLDTARRCVESDPAVRVLLLECTNLSPWKSEIRNQLGLPVFDLVDALEWIHASCAQTQ